MKYKSKDKSIAEDVVYQKIKGGWQWSQNENNKKPTTQVDLSVQLNNVSYVGDAINTDEVIIKKDEEIIVPTKIHKENKLLTSNIENIKIELLKSHPIVNDQIVREVGGIYFFTPQNIPQEHYAIKFLKNISASLNLSINSLLNFFK